MNQSTLDILWVVLCGSLVFGMQAGFLCLESGLTRSKHNINVALKNLTDFALATLLFWLVGFALMFGPSYQGWVGLGTFAGNLSQAAPDEAAFFFFQLMFCGTAVTILAGAVAERMRFGAYLVAAALIAGLIYPLVGHWVWGGAATGTVTGWLGIWGFVDFAGSTVVHSVGGWVALAALLHLGPRAERFPAEGPPRRINSSNVPLATLGVLLLWFGWYGFNGGSTFALDERVPQILLNTTLAGAAGLLGATCISWWRCGYAEVDWAVNGAIAGLVAITAGCHAVSALAAVLIGVGGGVAMLLVHTLLERLRIDDAVGAVPAHLGAGAWGTLAVAFFGQPELLATGLSWNEQLLVQAVGVVVTGVWAFGGSYVGLGLVKRVLALRVTAEAEQMGLNVSEHNARTELAELFAALERQSEQQDMSMRLPEDTFTEAGQIGRRYNRVMDALERAVTRTDTIVKTAADAIITFTPTDLTITTLNPATETIFGYRSEDLLGQSVARLFDLGDDAPEIASPEQVRGLLQELAVAGVPYELRGQRADGSVFPLEVLVARAGMGAATFYTGIFRNITERKQAEEALRRSQSFLQGVIDNLPASIYVKDTRGAYVLANRRFASTVGLSVEQIVGSAAADMFAPDALATWQNYENRVLQTGEPCEYEEVVAHPDGPRTNLSIQFPLANEAGAIYAIGGISTDITQLKQVEEELRRQKEYFETLVSNSPVAIITVDTETRVVSWNPAAERLFGYTPAEAAGVPIAELVTGGADPREALDYATRVLRGQPIQALTQRARKDGTLVDVELLAVPVTLEQEQAGIIAIYHDITELQRARRAAEAASQAKSSFLATMSHEIRTPMNAIIGMTGLLLDTPLDEEQREFAETVRTSSDNLLTIINDILDFSKIEAGKLELEHQPFDLNEFLESALDLVAEGAARKGLELACIIDEQVPGTIFGDVTRLRQVLVNLLGNAVKFTDQGEVVVSVEGQVGTHSPSRARLAGTGDDPDYDDYPYDQATPYELRFAVRDTGIGIPPDRLDRLFQPFSQVDASTTRQYGGTGLGLVISRRLVEMMGGSMWVESTGVPGEGATFLFTIQTHAGPTSAQHARLQGLQPGLKGKRLLIVDDNATNRRILVLQTRSWGMVTHEAASPGEALQIVRRSVMDAFDVAVLDMQMPGMDGVMLAAAITRELGHRTPPLVMLTSLGQRDVASSEEGVTFAAFLTKPIKASQLHDTLVGVLAADADRETSAEPGSEVRRIYTRSREETSESLYDPHLAERLPLRLLVAEDNATNQKLTLLMLKRLGYRADVAANGLEVLDALQRQFYDVVLMDVQMPEMDGLEATGIIRKNLPTRAQPRIVALTANALVGDAEMCLAAGMDDYISKPVDVAELIAALKKTEVHPALQATAREPDGAGREAERSAVNGPAADGTAAEMLLDRAAVQNLYATLGDMADEMLPDLVETFLKEATRLLNDAHQALQEGRAAEVRRIAHTLRSNSASFGALELEELCHQLDRQAKQQQLEGADTLLAQMAAEFARVRPSLERLANGER